ncbi:hypothetical protein llap_15151 [Limosa lapponica baueri]|uniref:Uncharacterized protein n=1 Tax=Limosa lapponica baueri TaxID=1758121 RepID=A0A2I0TL77_LIMLA|nr:hypothetical protein llap_15151 [Limosa lapponica baueri]
MTRGLDEQTVKWIESGLNGRAQKVVASSMKLSRSKFADDTKLGGVADTPEVHEATQRDLNRLEKRADRNLMKFDKERCQGNLIHQYVLVATQLESSFAEKDVGVLVDTKLNMASLMSQSLLTYVEEGNVPALKALLEKCRDVDERNENGQTPLMLAAEQGNLEIVQELLKKGANCNLEDADNWTALISAAKEGHAAIVAELLNYNVSLEHRDLGGWTALMWASYKGRTEVAKLLLEKGANPNITGMDGETPLIKATKMRNIEIVELLLDKGAKVSAVDKVKNICLL